MFMLSSAAIQRKILEHIEQVEEEIIKSGSFDVLKAELLKAKSTALLALSNSSNYTKKKD